MNAESVIFLSGQPSPASETRSKAKRVHRLPSFWWQVSLFSFPKLSIGPRCKTSFSLCFCFHRHTHTHTHTDKQTHTDKHTHTDTHTHRHTHTQTSTHTDTHTHRHTHTHTHVSAPCWANFLEAEVSCTSCLRIKN